MMDTKGYIPNAGQTHIPFRGNILVPFLPTEGPVYPDPPLPEPVLKPEFIERGIRVKEMSQHFLPGVTPEMIDWFWANMEKGYYLWAPGAHKRFSWVRSPGQYGFLESAHMISEIHVPGGAVFGGDGVMIQRMPLSWFPFTTHMEHVILEGIFTENGEMFDCTIHMWEGAEGGTNHITAAIENTRNPQLPDFVKELQEAEPPAPCPELGNGLAHSEYEAAMWPVFLPRLYDLWKDHPDPAQNVPCDLRVRELADGSLEYIAENGPVKIPRNR